MNVSFPYFWGTLGVVTGLLVAVGLFLVTARLVANARKGNRRVREARHDPHAQRDADGGTNGRDIAQ